MTRVATALLVSLLSLSLTGCGGKRLELRVETGETADIRLGVLPSGTEARMKAVYAPLCRYLSETLDRRVELVVAPLYRDLGYLMQRGAVEVGWFSSTAFREFEGRESCEPLARVQQNGKTALGGVIVVRKDSGIDRVEDLKGKRFAFVDRLSRTGFASATQLMLDHGVDPLNDLSEIGFTSSHLVSVREVASGKVDAAGVFTGVLKAFADKADTASLKVLPGSAELPNGMMVAAPHLSKELRGKLRDAFLAMMKTPAGLKALEEVRKGDPIDGFVAIE